MKKQNVQREITAEPGMNARRRRLVMFGLKVLYVLLQAGTCMVCWTLSQINFNFSAVTTAYIGVMYMVLTLAFHKTYNALDIGRRRLLDIFTGQALSNVLADALILLMAVLAIRSLPQLWPYAVMAAVHMAVSLVWCIVANRVYWRGYHLKRCAAVYSDRYTEDEVREGFKHSYHHMLDKAFSDDGWEARIDALKDELQHAEAIFLYGLCADLQVRLVRFGASRGIPVYIHPRVGDVLISTADHRTVNRMPMLVIEPTEPDVFYSIVKRTMDVVASALGLIVLSPVMLLVAAAIMLEDGKPCFYRQTRLTLGGREFSILKFRSMRTDAEKDGVARLAQTNDSRITRVGKFIRATRLDELPQLINILMGDMSLVGPRPERPEIAAEYERTLPEFRLRLRAKAGLTGYAQVNGRYNATPEDKLQMDLIYIADRSIQLDVKLILQTVQTVFSKEATEGVAEGQTTAKAAGDSTRKSA